MSSKDAEIADMDGQNGLDVVVAEGSIGGGGDTGPGRLCLNDGNNPPSFSCSPILPTDIAKSFGVAIADLEGDGDPDVVLSHWLCLNDGSNPPSFSCSTLDVQHPYSPAIGDFDGDQLPDIAVADHYGVEVCLNDGSNPPSFTCSFTAVGPGDQYQGLALADYDGDSNLDIFVGDSVCLNDGNSPPGFSCSALGIARTRKAVSADIDLANGPDIVTSSGYTCLNQGDASFICNPTHVQGGDVAIDWLLPLADLAVTKDDGVTSAVPGQTTLTYTIVASNAGPADEPTATLTDTFPGDLTCSYTSVAAGGATGNTAAGAGDLAETLALPAGSSVTYAVSCTIDPAATGTLSNTATISGTDGYPTPGNDSATDGDTVLTPEADLAVTKDDGLTEVVPGSSLTYTIDVSNAGPSADPAATLVDTLPAGLSCDFTSGAAGGATGNTASGSGDLAETLSLPVGGSVTYSLDCAVGIGAGGTLSNTATATASVTDPVPGNNSATDDTDLLPLLWIPDPEPAAEGEVVDVAVNLATAGMGLGGVAFSIDYDATCLDPDLDDDGTLDQVTGNVAADFDVTVLFDELDTDGEIDVSIADVNPPVAALADGALISVLFLPTCSPALKTTEVAPVVFSVDPAPSFSDQEAVDVTGSSADGAVEIYPGPRGDCNSTGYLSVADLVADGREIFDGDASGDADGWINAVNPDYVGSPVGCDANADRTVDAADVLETNDLIFGRLASDADDGVVGSSAPELTLGVDAAGEAGETVWLRFALGHNGWQVGAFALSLELDAARLDLAAVDADGNGTPDRVRFPAGKPGMATLRFDAAAGLLQILLADLSRQALGDGAVLEIGLVARAARDLGGAVELGSEPRPSFGLVGGTAIDGPVTVLGSALFADGFETGDTGRWSSTLR